VCSELLGLDLEGGPGVIVKPSDQVVIKLKRDAGRCQIFLETSEMVHTCVAQGVHDGWGACHDFPAPRYLAIKDPQGIRFRPSLAVGTEVFSLVCKIPVQPFFETGPALRTTKCVQMEAQVFQSEYAKEFQGKDDDLCIASGPGVPE
jgi:hypothetical protein